MSDDFLDSVMAYSGTAKSLGFVCENAINDDYAFIHKTVKTYSSRLLCAINPAMLNVPESIANETEICSYEFENFARLKQFYDKNVKEYLVTPWKNYFTQDYLKAIDNATETSLIKAKTFCLGLDGKPGALLALTTPKHYLDIREADWVLWIWIDSKLAQAERACVHHKLVAWMKESAKYPRLMAGINCFNTRSNKFFRKLGFKSECLIVSKLK
jgi:RimJ/RimL family protein N-acetyltransferase